MKNLVTFQRLKRKYSENWEIDGFYECDNFKEAVLLFSTDLKRELNLKISVKKVLLTYGKNNWYSKKEQYKLVSTQKEVDYFLKLNLTKSKISLC